MGKPQDLAQAKLVLEKRIGGISSIRFGQRLLVWLYHRQFNDTCASWFDNYNACLRNRIFLSPRTGRQAGRTL